jgi:hypothetical protein
MDHEAGRILGAVVLTDIGTQLGWTPPAASRLNHNRKAGRAASENAARPGQRAPWWLNPQCHRGQLRALNRTGGLRLFLQIPYLNAKR